MAASLRIYLPLKLERLVFLPQLIFDNHGVRETFAGSLTDDIFGYGWRAHEIRLLQLIFP